MTTVDRRLSERGYCDLFDNFVLYDSEVNIHIWSLNIFFYKTKETRKYINASVEWAVKNINVV